MISRYTTENMGQIWKTESRFQKMMEVEIAVAEVQSEMGIIPKKAAKNIRQKAKFNVEEIQILEKEVKHDVIAFVSNMAKYVGEDGKFIHFGLTSSDVLDTAFSLQVVEACDCLLESIAMLKKVFIQKIKSHKKTLCAGRTHGMHAEPTTFGYKLVGYLRELERNEVRILKAKENMRICKLSGAVGTYSSQPEQVENKLAKKLHLKAESVATQVIPRDRHAEMISSLALLGGGLERLATELRHLQRTEVSEVIEGFTPGQKGSSAMPHKKNPISGENITGLSRLLRSYSLAALENIALWHERDISHSSVERVMFPDAFILADYMVQRMKELISNLYVDSAKMLKNMENSQGQLYSSHVLLYLVKKGLRREEAYKIVQRLSHSLKPDQNLFDQILMDPELSNRKLIDEKALKMIFSGKSHIIEIEKALRRQGF
ncbi:MAG TPA: adenylosuccinate lyase [Pseudobdellovibrionaceae bacterium]|nr:adenylosuccinate lyase [Pseudobdellovibrionaceae bacterium]